MKEPTVAKRVRDVTKMLRGARYDMPPDEPDIPLTDVLVDLMHWAAYQQVDFAQMCERAAVHYETEAKA